MRYVRALLLVIIIAGEAGLTRADIFEQVRSTDSALRDVLIQDRAAYYVQTPGVDHQANEERVSGVKTLGNEVPPRARGLRDMDMSFDAFLLEQLRKDRDYKGLIALNHPMLLLEYSSPVLADVVKHYRMTSYLRLGIEQSRLDAIDRTNEGPAERLVRQSQAECLQRNENRGLVAAMKICQNSVKPLEMLMGIDGAGSLEDGRRKIHVVGESLSRLGLDQARVDKIVELTGEKVLSNDRYEERLAESTFARKAVYIRQTLIRQWHDMLEKFHATGRVSSGDLQMVSSAGVPVTVRVLADLDLLEPQEREILVFKFASAQAFAQTQQIYRQAEEYLNVCLRDPALNVAFRGILAEKRDYLHEACVLAEKERAGAEAYKNLVSAVGQSADKARERLELRTGEGTRASSSSLNKELMLNF